MCSMPDQSTPEIETQMREAAIYCDGPAVPWMTARDIAERAVLAAEERVRSEKLATQGPFEPGDADVVRRAARSADVPQGDPNPYPGPESSTTTGGGRTHHE